MVEAVLNFFDSLFIYIGSKFLYPNFITHFISFMKSLFKRDNLFATFFLFIIILLLKSIHINSHVFDPIQIALSDIDFNDIAFSKTKKNDEVDKNIVIINIGAATRKDMIPLLTKLKNYHTAAIGLDIYYRDHGQDPEIDSIFKNKISDIKNIVLAEEIDFDKKKAINHSIFYDKNAHTGYVNFIGENKGVIRAYSPFENINNNRVNSFTSSIIQLADINKYENLKERDNEIEYINYQRKNEGYTIVDNEEIMNNSIDSSLFSNKIVLIGIVDESGFNIEDKHYTPLNEEFAHKKVPDMNGIIIHANILSMILQHDYINRLPNWLMVLFSVLLAHIFMTIFIGYYIHKHIWFHLRFKTIQLITSIFFIYVGILCLRWNVYIDFTLLLVAIVMSVDILYFYEGIVLYLNKKFNYSTIFSKNKH